MNNVLQKVAIYMEKNASSYNGIMKALSKRINLANSVAKTNPVKAGYLTNKTQQSIHANYNAYAGRLGDDGIKKVFDIAWKMPPIKPYETQVYAGMENAFRAGKPQAASKIFATLAAGRTKGKNLIAHRFDNIHPSQYGKMIDKANTAKQKIIQGIGQSDSTFHF